MAEQQIDLDDVVRVDNDPAERTVKQYNQGVNKFLVQRGKDGTAIEWVEANRLHLVRKKPQPDTLPGFYPARSIMD